MIRRGRVGATAATSRRDGVVVGIDLMSVAAVEDSIRVHAGRYLRRVYTSRELRDCRTCRAPSFASARCATA